MHEIWLKNFLFLRLPTSNWPVIVKSGEKTSQHHRRPQGYFIMRDGSTQSACEEQVSNLQLDAWQEAQCEQRIKRK